MMKIFVNILISCVFVTLIMGCASSSPSRFYTLSHTTAPALTLPATYSVSVGPVSVPAVVDRPQIVVRVGPNQVGIDEFNRWASPLKNEIARVVAENLTSMLGTPRVTMFPQSTGADASYRVVIDVLRFDSMPGEAVTLDTVWTVRSTKENQLRTGRANVREPVPGNGYAPLVAAHSRAIELMSGDIADAIRVFEKTGK